MKDYMAPMEGITNHIYRRAYHRFYHPMDKYFTPFISAKPGKQLSFKEVCEVSPDTNEGLTVVPQILSNNAEDFIHTSLLQWRPEFRKSVSGFHGRISRYGNIHVRQRPDNKPLSGKYDPRSSDTGQKILKAFHNQIYEDYQNLLSGEKNVLFRMKELWNYMAPTFTNYEKYAKKI